MNLLFVCALLCVGLLGSSARADNPAHPRGYPFDTPQDAAAWEAALPITDLPQRYLETPDGQITLGYLGTYNPSVVYPWTGISINPKDIPSLNEMVGGSDLLPQSVSYSYWSSLNVKAVPPPPPKAYWDEKAKGFRLGYIDMRNNLFFKISDKLYSKTELAADADILTNVEAPEIIPIKVKPNSQSENGSRPATNPANATSAETGMGNNKNPVTAAQSRHFSDDFGGYITIAVILFSIILLSILSYTFVFRGSKTTK